ncbi:MAG TPA: dihydrodipicolinate synthase family protein [Herpetosiphonaceae bacterium]
MNWRGVIPAITTPFAADDSVDHAFLAEHCRWLADSGSVGIVPLGSLGEGATLSFEEKLAVLETVVGAVGDRLPVVPGIAALSTREAVQLAQAAKAAGASGLMVLPPYVYPADWRELKAHIDAVLRATDLPAMLYNNPPAYRLDFLPEQIALLAGEHPNLAAVKESSADIRRITAIRALLGERLEILMGVDDGIVEGVQAGAVGWIAGLVNAFPEESVALFELALAARAGGDRTGLEALYRWFLPLLRLDIGPKFVQMIKLTQELAGHGSARVRAPRLELVGEELEATSHVVGKALAERPTRGQVAAGGAL